MQDGRLISYQICREETAPAPGDLLIGRVLNVAQGISAAFVDIGDGVQAFLDTKRGGLCLIDSATPKITSQAKEGQTVLVQLRKAAFRDKLASLSAEIKFVGLHCILLPMGDGLRFSRDFRGDKTAFRNLFMELSQSFGTEPGWLIRSTASFGEPEWIKADALRLWQYWQETLQQLGSGKTRVVYKENPLMAAVRDGHKTGWRSIFCDNGNDHAYLQRQLSQRDPSLLPALKFHDADSPLFDTYRVEDEVAHLSEARLWLKSGGTLDIHQTEAMVTVDVNTAKNTKDRGGKSAGLRTNLEAAAELGRQIRARNLAGLIVIDFVNIRDKGWEKKVERALRDAMVGDEAKLEVLPINKFGVAMLARERTSLDLGHRTLESCRRCRGQGTIKTLNALSLDIQRQVRRQLPGMEGETLAIIAGRELSTYLREHQALFFEPLESQFDATIIIEEGTMATRAYRIDIQ